MKHHTVYSYLSCISVKFGAGLDISSLSSSIGTSVFCKDYESVNESAKISFKTSNLISSLSPFTISCRGFIVGPVTSVGSTALTRSVPVIGLPLPIHGLRSTTFLHQQPSQELL